MVKQDVKENKYKVLEIELEDDEGNVKTYIKPRVKGSLFREYVKLNGELENYTHAILKKLKVENKGVSQRELEQVALGKVVVEFGMYDKMADIIVKSFKNQFTRDELYDGVDADEIDTKFEFYFKNALSNGESVSEDTEDFLDVESKEEEK